MDIPMTNSTAPSNLVTPTYKPLLQNETVKKKCATFISTMYITAVAKFQNVAGRELKTCEVDDNLYISHTFWRVEQGDAKNKGIECILLQLSRVILCCIPGLVGYLETVRAQF